MDIVSPDVSRERLTLYIINKARFTANAHAGESVSQLGNLVAPGKLGSDAE